MRITSPIIKWLKHKDALHGPGTAYNQDTLEYNGNILPLQYKNKKFGCIIGVKVQQYKKIICMPIPINNWHFKQTPKKMIPVYIVFAEPKPYRGTRYKTKINSICHLVPI